MAKYREFVGSWEQLARAEAHAKALAEEWSSFCEDDPYSSSVSVDDEGNGRAEFWSDYEPLPSQFSLKLGEMLYQFRAALDSTIYGAAIKDSGQDPPPNEEKLEFPICSTADQFKNAARKIAPLAQVRREVVQVVQPYMG